MWSAVAQAISAALIAAFTLALVIYSHHGWLVAKKSADAAAASAGLAEKAFQATERAFLVVDNWAVTGAFTEGAKPQIKFGILNVGRQPAIFDSSAIHAEIGRIDALPADPVYPELTQAGGLPIHQTKGITKTINFVVDSSEAAAIEAGATINMWGILKYHDGFNKPRELRFLACYDKSTNWFAFPALPNYYSAD